MKDLRIKMSLYLNDWRVFIGAMRDCSAQGIEIGFVWFALSLWEVLTADKDQVNVWMMIESLKMEEPA